MRPKKLHFFKVSIFLSLMPLIALSAILWNEVNTLPQTGIENGRQTLSVETISSNDSIRDGIIAFGKSLLGTPYVYGKCSKDGFDCSGFVYFVFQHFKIEVPRSSSQYMDFGKEVSIDSLKKGDILVFLSPTKNVIGHVGIVTNPRGKKSEFIHASSGRAMKVMMSNLEGHYMKRFVKAVNVLGD